MDWPSLSPLHLPPLCVCTELCDVPGLPPRAASGGGRRTLLRYCTLSVWMEGASKWCTDSYTIHCAASICTQQWRPFTPSPTRRSDGVEHGEGGGPSAVLLWPHRPGTQGASLAGPSTASTSRETFLVSIPIHCILLVDCLTRLSCVGVLGGFPAG